MAVSDNGSNDGDVSSNEEFEAVSPSKNDHFQDDEDREEMLAKMKQL